MAMGFGLCLSLHAGAEQTEVPAVVQARLVSKIPAYDHGFRQRAGSRVTVLILTAPDHPESVREASLLTAALANESSIAGLPHESLILPFTDTAALTRQVRSRSASIVYITAGLQDSLESICKSLEPLAVMTVTPVPEYVERCVSVGFEVIGGRPKILVHLEHAQQNGLRFRSEFLELAKVLR